MGVREILESKDNSNQVTYTPVKKYVDGMDEAMRKWALQYAVHVKILSPGKLVDMVKEDIKKASEQYKGEH